MDLAAAIEDVDALLCGNHRIAVEIGGALLELGKVFDRFQAALRAEQPLDVDAAERYRPDAIDGSVVSGTISEGGRWMTRHQIELSRTRECPSLPSFSPLYFTFPSFLLFFGPRQRRAPH